MKPRLTLSSRILLLAFLNVALLVAVFAVFARVQFRFDLGSFLLAPARDRMFSVSRLIALELPQTPRDSWNQLLARHAGTYASQLFLFVDTTQVAGPPVTLPQQVMNSIAHHHHGPGRPPFEPPPGLPHHGPMILHTGNPGRYWVDIDIPVWNNSSGPPGHGTLVWMFSSLWTNPFFFDYRPWLAVILAVILVSVICWLPLIRGLTHSIGQLTSAAERIAEGHFDVEVRVKRRAELGQLGNAITSMAHRLSGYVNGQKRFLGDIAHELCSPIARIQVSLGILEQRAERNQREYVEGLREEVEHMSSLVNELLSFSRAQINTANTPLARVNVAETVRRVLEREAPDNAAVQNRVGPDIAVMAHPEYLFRSLANLVRNAVRYAGEAGPIVVAARNGGESVSITVADEGPGLPESELEEVFRPFYRPEFARQRETGGTGLGLAIVKTCVEACGGSVSARNRSPHGLEVELKLSAG